MLWDDFFERYLSWREACSDVRIAYDAWTRSEAPDVDLFFAAYGAALDREQTAAAACREAVARMFACFG